MDSSIPSYEAERFFSGARAIGYASTDFVLSRRMHSREDVVIVGRGSVQRRYQAHEWIELALNELRAGVFGKRLQTLAPVPRQ